MSLKEQFEQQQQAADSKRQLEEGQRTLEAKAAQGTPGGVTYGGRMEGRCPRCGRVVEVGDHVPASRLCWRCYDLWAGHRP